MFTCIFKIISFGGHFMQILLLNELLGKCFKFMIFFTGAGIIKNVCGAVHCGHFGTLGYGMVEINISGLRLNVAIFTAGTGTRVSAPRFFLPWSEPSPGLETMVTKAGSFRKTFSWIRSICTLIGESYFFLVWAVCR